MLPDSLYRSAVERSSFGFALHKIFVDAAGRPVDYEILETNKAFEDITGLGRDRVLGRRITELIPRILDDPFDWIGTYGKVAQGGGELEFERPFAPSGRWYKVRAYSPEPGYFVTLFSGLTERRSEEERAKAEEKKALYLSAIESLEQPLLLSDAEGSIVEVNRAFRELYGYSREEVLGGSPRLLNPGKPLYLDLGYSEEEYEGIFRGLWEALKDPARGSWRGRLLNRRKDGHLVWVELLVNAIRDSEGRLTHFVGLPVDVSESVRRDKLGKVELYATIAELADLRDNETGNHMKRVGLFAKLLAKASGRPSKYCEDIEVFAPMHDIGKVGIQDALLRARRRLEPAEYEEMKKHTLLGHNIVKGKKELEMVSAIALCHHERWDGSGYPNGLAGEDIPLSARITAVADVYDALRSERPYKRAWTHEEAAREIEANSGTQFDPALVARFKALRPAFEKVYAELA